MSRLDTLKRIGFPPEYCPKCSGDGCGICKDGVFTQRVRQDWEPPPLDDGQKLYAFQDYDEWYFFGVVDQDEEEVTHCYWPFDTDFATADHFRNLGFEVVQ